MARKYSSIAAEGTLTGALTASATAVNVSTVTGWPTSYPYTIIIDPDTASEEVCTVSAAVGLALTVIRGVDGTTGKTHNAGAVVKHGVSARDFSEPQVHIDATTTVHGITDTAALVTLNGSQTLTNKTLTAPVVSSVSNGGTVTFPTSTDTLVARATSDTLTNKTINASSNTISNIANSHIAAAAAIDKTKIAGTAVTVADTGTVTNTMLAGSIDKTKISGTAVTVADTGTVTNAMLAGSIANAKLTNSSVTIGSTNVALGATAAEVSGLTLNGGTIKAGTNLINSGSILTGVVNGSSMLQGGIQLADISSAQSLSNKTIDAASTLGGVSGTTLAAERTAWTSYTPAFEVAAGGGAAPSVGTGGSRFGYYKQIGKTVHFRAKIIVGVPAGGSIGGGGVQLTIGLPVACAAGYTGSSSAIYQTFGQWTAAAINGATIRYGSGYLEPYTVNAVALVTHTTSRNYTTNSNLAGQSVTWYTDSYIEISGTYEAA